MKTVSKQTVLKGALLAALAANISWQTQSTFTTDLASEQGTTSAAKLPPAPPAVTIRTAPASAAKAGNSGPKPEAAARTQVATEQVKRDEVLLKLEACDKESVVTFFEEKADDGKIAVRGHVKINGRNIGATNPNLTLEKFKASEAKQDAFMKLFATEAEKSCATDVAVESDKQPEQGRAEDDSEKRSQRRADRIARGLRNCTGDAQGRALKSDDKIECHLDRISSDETEEIDDMDREDRASRRKRSNAKNQFASSVDYLVGEVSALLSSDDADDRRDGKSLKKDLEDALKDARDNGVVSRSEVSLAQARVKALDTGMNLDARTDFYARQASQIDQQAMQLRQQLPQAQMQSPMYAQMIQQQLQSLEQQKRALATNSMAQDQFYTTYAGLRNQGVVHAEEYSTFSKSYEDLMRALGGNQSPTQIGGAPGQTLPGTSIMPSAEATTFRNNPNGNNLDARSGGFATPAFPRI